MSDPQQYGAMPPPPAGYQQPKGPAPANVVLAVRLMLLGAAISALSLIVVFTAKDQFRDAIRKSNIDATTSHIDDLANTAIAIAAVVAAVILVLYVLLALQVRKGKNWARIVTWVFAGLGVLSALSALAQDQPTLDKVIGLVQGVLDVAIIVLLAQSRGQAYFRKQN